MADTDSSGVVLTPVDTDGVIPDVRGMGLKEAIYLLEKNGATVTFSGQGRVVSQSVKPGAKAHRGMVVSLTLKAGE